MRLSIYILIFLVLSFLVIITPFLTILSEHQLLPIQTDRPLRTRHGRRTPEHQQPILPKRKNGPPHDGDAVQMNREVASRGGDERGLLYEG
mmetsp:Transcript_19682/g.24313  ORF Transcript_19682/g.24313 Transcript_19682/m.24313 type:complete len:91 (+) Transcript_19682:118-390(+)